MHLFLQGGLFQSSHGDDNTCHSISHKCSVLPLKEYLAKQSSESSSPSKKPRKGDTFYLAGTYDPVAKTMSIQHEVPLRN